MGTMQENVLQEAKEALEGLDAARLVSCYGDPFLFEDIPARQRITTQEELKEYFQRLFSLPSVRFTDIKIYESEGWAALEWVWWGSAKISGHTFRIPGASVIELVDGKIKRETIYYDPRASLD